MSTQCYDCVATLKNLGTVDSADALREFESLAVGLHVPNCELFGGRSSYKESVRESVSRLRIYFPRASLAQSCTANAMVESLGKNAQTNGWWAAADSLRSAYRSMRVLMFSIS